MPRNTVNCNTLLSAGSKTKDDDMDCFQEHLTRIRVPTAHTSVYKDECVYSFDSPVSSSRRWSDGGQNLMSHSSFLFQETETGLYVCLNTFLGYGEDFVGGYHKKTGNSVFLHIRRLRHEIAENVNIESSDDGPEKKITRLAIGVEGGFDANAGKDRYTYEDVYKVVVLPQNASFPFPCAQLPDQVTDAVNAVIAAESATKKTEREAVAGTWDGEVRTVSRFAENLEQLVNDVPKIPPSGWKCQNCDLTTNLWLNLTDGSIMCGRRFFDGTGGNDHAVEHYRATGYPLAVKLGTITADGKGDVYSYKEDDMVENPHLAKHLGHFGIKVQQLEKTDKSMVELELDLNQRMGEWNLLCESASNLEPICGPGYTGMRNLGNSCYLNSVMQVVFTMPDFVKRYVAKAPEIFGAYPSDPANDFNVQMAKLGTGLLSGKYSGVAGNSLDSETTGVAPVMFKQVSGVETSFSKSLNNVRNFR